MRVHHIGYLVRHMNEAIREFHALGYKGGDGGAVYDPLRHVNICFMENQGITVELVAPADGCELFTKLQKKIGNSPYHLCYVTNGIFGEEFDQKIENLQKEGWLLVQQPEPASALGGRRVAFLMNDVIGLIEFVEDF